MVGWVVTVEIGVAIGRIRVYRFLLLFLAGESATDFPFSPNPLCHGPFNRTKSVLWILRVWPGRRRPWRVALAGIGNPTTLSSSN
ncbi:hypothetical protein SO802_014139 [Lithocarpus litseifolius]|uniref:Secreted protein n=1 Tax=Lithocarpus litseifolius TaxID=425828 RepID=A0AAW2CS52_9ROSI